MRDDVVVAIHRRQIAEHGGEDGVRDMNLLLSALGRPKNLWTYSNPKPDLASLAASYAFGIARNHAFIDGNKRTAFVVCRTFLLLNDSDLPAIEIGRYASFLKLAAGDLSEADLAEWIRSGLRPR